MGEDDFLEAEYENRNGGELDTATIVDVNEDDDEFYFCNPCQRYSDDCECF